MAISLCVYPPSLKTVMNSHNPKVTVKTPVIDGMVFVLLWGSVDAFPEQFEIFKQRVEQGRKDGSLLPPKFATSRYKVNFRIPLSNGNDVLVQIGGMNKSNNLRISLNPSKMSNEDVLLVNERLAYLIGPAYEDLIQRPRLTAIHVAVDIHGVELDDLLVTYKYNQKMTFVEKILDRAAKIETMYFGSMSSDYIASVYYKTTEQIEASIKHLIRLERAGEPNIEPLRQNVVRQLKTHKDGPKIVRVEVRATKLKHLPFGRIDGLENRFKRFQIADLLVQEERADLSVGLKAVFLAFCRQKGVKAGLRDMPLSLRRKVNAYWKVRQAPWWSPDPMWAQACKSLRDSGLFPLEAFDLPATNG